MSLDKWIRALYTFSSQKINTEKKLKNLKNWKVYSDLLELEKLEKKLAMSIR